MNVILSASEARALVAVLSQQYDLSPVLLSVLSQLEYVITLSAETSEELYFPPFSLSGIQEQQEGSQVGKGNLPECDYHHLDPTLAHAGNPVIDYLPTPYLPTPSPTPSTNFQFPQEDPNYFILWSNSSPSQVNTSLGPHSQSSTPERPADHTNDGIDEEPVGGASGKRRKKRRIEGTAPAPDPAERKKCKRGRKKVAKSSRRGDRPQESHYHSEEEVRGEEPLEQTFSPAQIIPVSAPEKQCLPERALHFVLALSHASQDVVNANSPTSCSVFQLFQTLQGLVPNELQSVDDSLQNLALRCIRAQDLVSSLDFIYMLNCIQLRCKVVSTCLQTKKAPTTVLRSIKVQRSPRTLGRYVLDGAKYCLLAGGGSIFVLALVAIAKLKARVHDADLTHEVVQRINHLLRDPAPDCTLGKAVVRDIIPAIAILRQRHQIAFSTMFSSPLLFSNGVPPVAEISDLQRSDEFFDMITFNAFLKPRSKTVWKSCYCLPGTYKDPVLYSRLNRVALHLQPSVHSVPSIQIPKKSCVEFIDTKYDPGLHETPSYSKLDDSERYSFTEKEREKAEQAVSITSLEEFRQELEVRLKTGTRSSSSPYIQISSDICNGGKWMVKDKDRDVLLLVLPDLPSELREPLVRQLQLSFGQRLTFTDSQKAGEGHQFESFHFTHYNRYSARGDACPPTQDPSTYRKDPKKKKINSCQYLPRAAAEIQDHIDSYRLIAECLEPVFSWVRDTLKEVLPEDYEVVKLFADVLPAGASSPAFPFGGFVVNLNVSTLIHRDEEVLKLCLVLTILEDSQGGDLCFFEPGLRLSLRHGDMVAFRSDILGHFNLHFTGKRASIVLHTDRAGMEWVANRNGWKDSSFINVSWSGGGDL